MLTHIPVISPIEIRFTDPSARRLLPPAEPDYTVHALEPAAVPIAALGAGTGPAHEAALVALDEMESAARVSEYHDFAWWSARIATVRDALTRLA